MTSVTASSSEQTLTAETPYKVLVVGDIGVGKTSLIKKHAHGTFSAHYKATIGVDYILKTYENLHGYSVIRMSLWDIAGQERFGQMTRTYYTNAHACFIVFDKTRMATFDNVVKWKDDVNSKIVGPDGKPLPIVILGNKSDLNNEWQFRKTASEIDSYVREHGFAGYFDTSAKEGKSLDDAGPFILGEILKRYPIVQPSTSAPGSVILTQPTGAPEQKSGCPC